MAMTYTGLSSLIKTTGHYSADQLWAVFKPMTPPDQYDRAYALLKAVAPLCAMLNLDEVAVAAIIWIETGAPNTGLPFRSSWWVNGLNAGNIGITGDEKQNAAAQTWQTPKDAALGLVSHVVAYAYGSDWQRVWDVDELGKPQTWDKRFPLVLSEYKGAQLDTLESLNGRWAWDVDNDYHGKLANRANKLIAAMDAPVETPSTGEEPVAKLIFGRVPKPPMKVMIVPKGASGQTGWFQCPPRHNVGFMAHETQGTSSGGWYFDFFSCPNGERCGDALVDFLIDQDGTIYMYNDPEGTRAPWANGGGALSSGGLEGDGIAYVNYFGLAAVDTKTISCEIVKAHGAPMKPVQIVSLGTLFAYYADRDEQPFTDWPAIAKYNDTRVYLNHFEIGTTNCFINNDDNDKVIAEVQINLKAAQEGGAPAKPVYATADPMPTGTFIKNDRLFLEVNKEYTTQRPTKPFRYADFKPDQQTGPEIPKGAKVKVLHVVSDTGATSDLTLEIDTVKVGDETVPKGSRIDGRVIA